jgi:hypothetical protein
MSLARTLLYVLFAIHAKAPDPTSWFTRRRRIAPGRLGQCGVGRTLPSQAPKASELGLASQEEIPDR